MNTHTLVRGHSAPATNPIAVTERLDVLDVLRGFALLGILVVNMAAFKGSGFGSLADASTVDKVAAWVIAFGFQTKFYVIFSFLFGYGLSVQMNRAAARGASVVPRFLRRLMGLLVLGILHALLLYVGDILVTYAVLGVVLLLLRNASDRVVVRVAVLLIAATTLLLLLGSLALTFVASEVSIAEDLNAEATRTRAAYRGSALDVIGQRVREYPGTLAFALFGQGPTALAMFLLGLWSGRQRLLERIEDVLPLLHRVLRVGLVVGIPGALVWATFRVRNGFTFDSSFLLAAAVDFATAPFLSAVYSATLVLLLRIGVWRRRLAPLALVGRMSLSNYLLQSLIGAWVFTGYGLGLYGHVGTAAGLGICIMIFAVQIPLSGWWLRRFQFGPAEWLLRSWTYARLQPLRRQRAPNE